MQSGSVEETAARLKLWCAQRTSGLARVEWDSVYARQEVVSALRGAARIVELEIRSDVPAVKKVATILDELAALPAGCVASITGIEGIFPDPQERLATFAALSFQRERLGSLPVKQIWWLPSHLADQFVLAVPDLDSWFQLRLHLSESPGSAYPLLESVEQSPIAVRAATTEQSNVDYARALAARFYERSTTAKSRGVRLSAIWRQLGKPAYSALANSGFAADARRILEGMQELAETRLPVPLDHADARDLRDFASALGEAGDYPSARRWQEALLAASRDSFGQEDPDTLTAMLDLASTLHFQGDLVGSKNILDELMAISRRNLPPDDPITLGAKINMAAILYSWGDLPAAKELQRAVLETCLRTLGEYHSMTLTAMNNLAQTLKGMGELDEARNLAERVFLSAIRLGRDEHPYTLAAMNNFGAILAAQGDLAAARRLWKGLVSTSSRALGPDHPETLRAMNNLAQASAAEGDILEASELQNQVLELRRRLLGEMHPETLKAKRNLAQTLAAQGNLAEARQLEDEIAAAERLPSHAG